MTIKMPCEYFPPHKLDETIKKQRTGKEKTVPINNPEWVFNAGEDDLVDLARKLVKGELPREIGKGSEFYQLLAELAKQEGLI